VVWNRMWCGERGEGRGSNRGPCHRRGGEEQWEEQEGEKWRGRSWRRSVAAVLS
jgi:hypothetical protein